jgi:hypothetical protein
MKVSFVFNSASPVVSFREETTVGVDLTALFPHSQDTSTSLRLSAEISSPHKTKQVRQLETSSFEIKISSPLKATVKRARDQDKELQPPSKRARKEEGAQTRNDPANRSDFKKEHIFAESQEFGGARLTRRELKVLKDANRKDIHAQVISEELKDAEAIEFLLNLQFSG